MSLPWATFSPVTFARTTPRCWPPPIRGRGRRIGDYLLALEESKGVRGVLR